MGSMYREHGLRVCLVQGTMYGLICGGVDWDTAEPVRLFVGFGVVAEVRSRKSG